MSGRRIVKARRNESGKTGMQAQACFSQINDDVLQSSTSETQVVESAICAALLKSLRS